MNSTNGINGSFSSSQFPYKQDQQDLDIKKHNILSSESSTLPSRELTILKTKYDLNNPYSLPCISGGSFYFDRTDFINSCYKCLPLDTINEQYEQSHGTGLFMGSKKIFALTTKDLIKIFVTEFQKEGYEGLILQGKNKYWVINSEKALSFPNFVKAQEELFKLNSGNYLIELSDKSLHYVIYDKSCGMTKKFDDKQLMNRLFPTIYLNESKGYKDIKNNIRSLEEVLNNDPDFRDQILEKMAYQFPSVETCQAKIAYMLGLNKLVCVKRNKITYFSLNENPYYYLNEPKNIETQKDHLKIKDVDDLKNPSLNKSTNSISSFLSSIKKVMEFATPLLALFSMLQSVSTTMNANQQSATGPFKQIELIKQGQLSNQINWLHVVPFTESPTYDGVLMTSYQDQNIFKNTASYITIEQDGTVKRGRERIISSAQDVNSGLMSMGVEISGGYVEVFRNSTPNQFWLNVIDSNNNVQRTCRVSDGIPIAITKFDDSNVMINANIGGRVYLLATNLPTCQSPSLSVSTAMNGISYIVSSNNVRIFYSYLASMASTNCVDKNLQKACQANLIMPFMYNGDPNFGGFFKVIPKKYFTNNDVLVAVRSIPQSEFCSQPTRMDANNLSAIGGYFCQSLAKINNIFTFNLQSASRNQELGYITSFEYISPDKSTKLTHVVPTSSSGLIPTEDNLFLTDPFVFNDTNWVNQNTPQRTFIAMSKLKPGQFTLFLPDNEGLKYYSLLFNPIIVINTNFTGQVNMMNNTFSIFNSTLNFNVKYNFTLLNQDGCLNDPSFTYSYANSDGKLNVFSLTACTRNFFAQACTNVTNVCANTNISIRMIGTANSNGDPLSPLYYLLIGAAGVCCIALPCVCFILFGTIITSVVVTKKMTIKKYNKQLQIPLLGDKDYQEYNKMDVDKRSAKISNLLIQGRKHLDDHKTKEALECFLNALALDRRDVNALEQILKFIKKVPLFSKDGFEEGLRGDEFLTNYQIRKHQSIEYSKNQKGKDIILGKGTFGIVYKGNLTTINDHSIFNSLKTTPVAFKVIHKKMGDSKVIEKQKKEAEINLRLSGFINLVSCLGIYEDNDVFMIIMEYMTNGTLESHLLNNYISPKKKHEIILDITRGLSYLHYNGVVHRDLKPANVLLGNELIAKIADFGESHKDIEKLVNTTQAGGTPVYMAPEVLSNSLISYSPSCDIYSFGMLLWTILKEELPYKDVQNVEELIQLVVIERKLEEIPDKWHPVYKDIIAACLSEDPKERPHGMEIYQNLIKFEDWILGKEVMVMAKNDYLFKRKRNSNRVSEIIEIEMDTFNEDENEIDNEEIKLLGN
jgi:hypothetical protein